MTQHKGRPQRGAGCSLRGGNESTVAGVNETEKGEDEVGEKPGPDLQSLPSWIKSQRGSHERSEQRKEMTDKGLAILLS